MHMGIVIGLLVVLLIIVVYVTAIGIRSAHCYCQLPGFYKADPQFCTNAELKSMYMFLDEPEKSIHPAYVVMEANQGIIMNEPVRIKIRERWDKPKNWVPFGGVSFNKYYTLSFVEMQGEVLPRRLDMEYDPKTGRIQMFEKDKLVARLYKDNHATELCKKPLYK